ncbi:hypothetical protein A9267_10020 [Shewanella sp. UCD-FRSSP16_17]|uniref:hypothetical protein n=1 Tax=Shewanella sp. UCD-FRSSP16_17 TaxID=1853256 RepID=UPI0007EED404|nr:hypothetical protein [Shewanella sp. UCD-FRSSP16_17]OBT08053.1 hypothetical protein A9267_10020 [Shewanella sp. UCD-FRSSP16_17]
MSTKVCSSCLKRIDSAKFQTHLLSECVVRHPNKKQVLVVDRSHSKKVKEASLVTASNEVKKPICPHCSVTLKDENRLAIHLSSKCPKSPAVILKKKQQARIQPVSTPPVARKDVDRLTYVLKVKSSVSTGKGKPISIYPCPLCKLKFASKDTLEQHMTNRCPMVSGNKPLVKLKPKKKKKSPKKSKLRGKKLTQHDATVLKQALSIKSSDPAIAAFLEKNPVKEQISHFGVPQDKYRRSAYGRSGMEYDSWSRNK